MTIESWRSSRLTSSRLATNTSHVTSRTSTTDDDGFESTQPAEQSRRVWWAECTLCGTVSYGGRVPVFESRAETWAALEGDDYGWARRDDGRVLCRIHSQLADCHWDGADGSADTSCNPDLVRGVNYANAIVAPATAGGLGGSCGQWTRNDV